ncbi:hypothetical protein BT63DRAFT_215664 [Microthyrium microscopicum]|uniref:Cell division control protein n=1 Tax=Microthyrium microscopicum TaxID=703497 RepID=A0A6A6UGI6_9PEZI|nr:hypothetical protein BT63DRAFT_215664 [Microthyrium microscopicum]
MPAAAAGDAPGVSYSFANNFWGKDDAGVAPLLERMHNAKTTCDEIKTFYSTRAAIEDEYARKLAALGKKPLGSGESGTLRMSLDTIRKEVESMAKEHQTVANQMKSELDEQLAINAGGLKERRKVIQTAIEKLYKLKCQQTATLNKTREKYKQDCWKAKGYSAQSHMVMGQEERKNKAKLEKTYAQMATTSTDYQDAVAALQETTGRWNREWKNACDKFQDLEEERIEYLKDSLWIFANISSTVCVTDDQSCENMRLSLEKCDVDDDIMSFIKIQGTGQEIPDPPKFIDFRRDDADDTASEVSVANNCSIAQFPRALNPSIRPGASSPQPSVFESHHDPNSALAREMGIGSSPLQATAGSEIPEPIKKMKSRQPSVEPESPYGQPTFATSYVDPKPAARNYPPDQFSRSVPPLNGSDMSSSSVSYNRRPSQDSHSELSQNSFTSYEASSVGHQSPVKQMADEPAKKNPWYKSPFSRSKASGLDSAESTPTPTNRAASRNTWGPVAARQAGMDSTPSRNARGALFSNQRTASPDPMIDPSAKTQLNIGSNIFDVSPNAHRQHQQPPSTQLGDPADPLEQALADLADITKGPRDRESADHHLGLHTPNPGSPLPGAVPTPFAASTARSTPPPAYAAAPIGHLGAPPAAHTARDMHAAKNRYVNQRRTVFDDGRASPNPVRATSPRPPNQQQPQQGTYNRPPSAQAYNRPASRNTQAYTTTPVPRATSPNPYASRPRANTSTPQKNYNNTGSWGSRGRNNASPAPPTNLPPRAVSPNPAAYASSQSRPASRVANGSGEIVTMRGRPNSQYYPPEAAGQGQGGQVSTRVRSKSVADGRQFTKDGRVILHFTRAMYMYQAQIPEELGFGKGDVLAVLRLQDDGWWEAESVNQPGNRGLVPSNYLQAC